MHSLVTDAGTLRDGQKRANTGKWSTCGRDERCAWALVQKTPVVQAIVRISRYNTRSVSRQEPHMGKAFDHITDDIRQFVGKQHLFFVATAPLAADGHVNLSPKGMDCFRILGANQVAYLDLTGSGNETSAHIAENGRITFMFCAFQGSPNIVRLYGTGRTVLPDAPEWAALCAHFPDYIGVRQIIVADIHRTSTSCGYAVPFMDYRGERETLTKYWEAKADEVTDYQRQKNSASIDGIPTPIGDALKG